MPAELHDVPRGFLKDIDFALKQEAQPLIIDIEYLQLFLPLYSEKARVGYTGEQLEAITKEYFKLSKGGLRELVYPVGRDKKNDIVLKSLNKQDIEIGNGFYYAMHQIKLHGHDPAFTKESNMKRLDKMVKDSVKRVKPKKDENFLENYLADF